MNQGIWIKEFPASITVCDTAGTIVELNENAARTFEKDGGLALLGRNLLECHPEPARSRLEVLLQSGSQNCYTIEKGGKKKLICQLPWYENGVYRGLVEISIALPEEMPHFIRE